MKISLVEDASKVWTYGTMRVQYFATAFAIAWLAIGEEQRQSLLGLFGVSPTQALGVSTLLVVMATALTRHTEIKL